jgi:asparagine synthase (glutamine-hydrolysing)
VLLSGEGADETLGGYVRYQPLRHPALLRLARWPIAAAANLMTLQPRARKLHRFLGLGPLDRFVLHNACEVLPNELSELGLDTAPQFGFREQVLNEARLLYPHDLVRQAMYSDQHTFLCSILDRNDRMTMGSSIECRVPFLDYRLVEGAGALPSSSLFSGSKGKAIMRRALGSRLPADVLAHRKWGFAVPWNRYFRDDASLRQLVQTLADREPCRDSVLDRGKVRQVTARFLAGDDRYEHLIRQLVMVDVWYHSVIQPTSRQQPVPPVDTRPVPTLVGAAHERSAR